MALTYAAIAIVIGILSAILGWWKNKGNKKRSNGHHLIADASYGIALFAGLNLIYFGAMGTDIFGQSISHLYEHVALGGLAIVYYSFKGLSERLK